MMTGPDEETPGRGQLRAAHADRERVVDVLETAFVQGRLDAAELDARLGGALAARTYAELAALTADIPSAAGRPSTGPSAARGARTPARIIARAACWSVICLLVAVILAAGGMLVVAPVLVVPILAPLLLVPIAAGRRAGARRGVSHPRLSRVRNVHNVHNRCAWPRGAG